ncbi:TonB-dependent receptor [Kineobactrum salinum]|uniref:TonB-dependent receptor n=1 Tax=Kineobactrum salinum TaxID=2708301 RepID=A0A6C0U4F8_9GAMM|nr:TonB-dependent receptor [Kineobactrum salinum]
MRGVAKLVNGAILDILGTLPLVSQFVDDVPVIAASSRQRDFNTFDFDRVEILKGPQPTYFGEGSVGGTVRYFSATPTLESGVSGKVNANLSTTENGGDNHTLNGVVDLTLIPDKLGVRLVGFTRDDDGFIDNELTGQEDYNDYRSDGGRLVVLALPTDELRIQFSAHVANDDHGGDWIADVAASNPQFSQRPLDEEWQDDYELYNLTLEYDFGPVRVTSITGYYERELSYSRYDFVQALNSLPVLFGIQGDVITNTYTRDENLTQELRLVSDLQGPLNFVAGLFYKDADSFNSSSAVSPQIEALNANFLALTGSGAEPNGLFFGSEVVGDPANREQLAVFGELTFEVSDRVRLIGGARWLNEDLASPVQNPATQNDPALAVCALAADFTPDVSFPNNPASPLP